MTGFNTLRSVAAWLPQRDINTDMVIPARFLRRRRDEGYGPCLFHDLRHGADGTPDPDFVLNRAPWNRARILIAGENFGCGSSREHAVHALHDHGIRAIIAPSFGDIFHTNCFNNGVLPIRLADPAVTALGEVAMGEGAELAIDLPAQTVSAPGGLTFPFEIDPLRKRLLVAGVDEITYTLRLADRIAAFEAVS